MDNTPAQVVVNGVLYLPSVRSEVKGPYILGARQIWFHSLSLPDALRATADWLESPEARNGNYIHRVLVDSSSQDEEGHECGSEDNGARDYWHIGILQDT